MSRRYGTRILLGFFFGFLWACPANAQDRRRRPVELHPIVVTATRSGLPVGDVSENIVVLGEGEVAMLPAQRLSDVLQYVPGVDIEPRSGPGQPTALTIQGSDSRQVRVMIDGIPLSTQSSGQVNPSNFPVNSIGRVEVIRGPGSSAWGSALGGVINVITKDTGARAVPSGSVSSSVAGYDSFGHSMELSGKALDVGYYLTADYRESGGKGPRSDVLEKKLFNKLSYALPGGGDVFCSFGYDGGDVNDKFPDGTWQAQPYHNSYGKAGIEDDIAGARVKAELKHFRQDLVTRSFADVADDAPLFEVNTRDRLYELSLLASRTFRSADVLVAGADFDYSTLKSDPYLRKQEHLFTSAPYANYTLTSGPWDFIAGARYDHNSEFGKEFSPSAGTVYRFGDPWASLVRAKVSRAFNAPPLLWKFNDNPALGVAPNPEIRAERGVVYELEAESSPLPMLRLKGSVYRADIKDALAREEVSSGIFAMKNFQKFRRQGAELQAKLKLTEELSLTAAAAFNDIENRVTRKTVKGGGKARQSFDIGAEYAGRSGFSLALQGYYKRWNQPASAEPNDRKFIADLKAKQKIGKNWELFLTIYNVTNSSYWADNFYPIRKRYFESGFTFSW